MNREKGYDKFDCYDASAQRRAKGEQCDFVRSAKKGANAKNYI